MIATLPMYDWPELHAASDALWQHIHQALLHSGLDAPANLARFDSDGEAWLRDDLLLSQTCGYPLATKLCGKVQYVASPVYSVEGCRDARYSSALLVHRHSQLSTLTLAGTRLAYNSRSSLSGYRCLESMFGEPDEHFGALIKTGSHRQSARSVATGNAEIVAIDAVCWHLLQQHEPQTARQLRVIGWTALRPSLPFITALKTSHNDLMRLRQVLREIFSASNTARTRLSWGLAGIEVLDLSEYQKLAQS
jgi:ABC-type phosphate/phosphonate transport system substrate-binding protein